MNFNLFLRAFQQLEIAKSDGESAYFSHLLYIGELVTKVATAGMCSNVLDDSDRHRYALIYRLVRADGVGEWAQVLDEIVNGPTSTLLRPEVQNEKRELNTRTTSDAWQYKSISLLDAALRELSASRQGLPTKLEGRLWFSYFAELRNATRGHGVLHPSVCAKLSTLVEDSIRLLIDNFSLFHREWVYLHKNLSGKYRVTKIGSTDENFQPLKSTNPDKWGNLVDGTYLFSGSPVRVDLLFTDADLTDYYLPNGNFRSKGFEIISYLTNSKKIESGGQYLVPATQLPPSETQGRVHLGVSGESFCNLPGLSHGYVHRPELEERLVDLLTNDRHPLISLIGRGGIGKTSLALKVLHKLGADGKFAAILWFSSRDIDLLPTGPKPVRPHLLDEKDMAKEFSALIGQLITLDEDENPLELFAKSLTKSPIERPILFVFDNFETVSNPVQVYNWVDTYIRNPNKVLITSRFREFKGDYAVDVFGMEEGEAKELISRVSETIDITDIVDDKAADEIYRESDGHPYVIKLLLGEIARQGRLIKIERVVAGNDEVLDALFERSYVKLTPAAQLIFLTLSSWRSTIPRVAIEAVMLRPANERLDVEAALNELEQSSFIEILSESEDNQDFISIPLSAAIFGRKRLETSPTKLSVEANMQLLLFFGAGQRSDLRHGIAPRIERFFKRVAMETASDDQKLQQYLPTLEYLSRRYTKGWLLLSQLLEERSNRTESTKDAAIEAIRRYIEASDSEHKREGWEELVRLAKVRGDVTAEIHGMMELASLPAAPFDIISDTANRLNSLIKWQTLHVAFDERRLLAEKLMKIADRRIDEGDATDLSRLAWLSLNLGDEAKAEALTLRGLIKEPENEYCLRLAERQGI